MEDGWRVAEGTCMFNQYHILEQIKYNDNLPHNKKAGNIPQLMRRGNFYWKDGVKDCGEVFFRDEPDGRFYITWMPREELQNNNYYRNGILHPGNSKIGAFGIDPYRVSKTVEVGKGSKGGMHGYTKENNETHSNFFFWNMYAVLRQKIFSMMI